MENSFLPITAWILILTVWRVGIVKKKKSELDYIAIGSGHPWHHSDDVEDTTVYVFDQEKKWIPLHTDVRIAVTADPLLQRVLLRDGDSEGEVLARCENDPFSDVDVIKIINMAQALASAQTREEELMMNSKPPERGKKPLKVFSNESGWIPKKVVSISNLVHFCVRSNNRKVAKTKVSQNRESVAFFDP